MTPPSVNSTNAAAGVFSAARAMADLEVIARQPHAAGSPAQAKVREYIVTQLEALGLSAELEARGSVTNILVSLPGNNPTGTILVTGHYDSHPPAPGAGDDGISTAAMLETIRVLHASPTLPNNVLFLFSDGEELGYLGAYAFLSTHRQARNELDLVLCFDARPGSGPLILQETSPGDAWLVEHMSGLPLAMWAGSWNNRAERGEIDTDCTVFFQAGFTGVEIENAESGTRYHTTRDTVDAISPRMVQAYGQTIFSLVDHFGTVDLSERRTTSDLGYFTLPLVGLVSHPLWITPIISILSLLALLVFTALAWRRKQFSLGRFGLSFLGFLLGTIFIVLCAQLIWGLVKSSHTQELGLLGGFEASTAWLSGMMLGAVILVILLLALLARRFGSANLLPAAALLYLLVWILVYLLMDADNPFTTAYVAWPLFGGAAGMGILLFARHSVVRGSLLALCALMVLIFLVPQLWLAAYTREDAWIPVLAACLPLGLFSPQIEEIFGKND